jgi:hypothetical protein
MKISSEKNPLPGRYASYKTPSDEEHALLMETLAREREEYDRAMDSDSVVEEEPSGSENEDVAHMSDVVIGDENVNEIVE